MEKDMFINKKRTKNGANVLYSFCIFVHILEKKLLTKIEEKQKPMLKFV